MQVRQNDFQRQWQEISPDARRAVERVGESGWCVLGNEVERFERLLTREWGTAHSIGVGSSVGPESSTRALAQRGAPIGSNMTLLPGIVIGRNAIVGVGDLRGRLAVAELAELVLFVPESTVEVTPGPPGSRPLDKGVPCLARV